MLTMQQRTPTEAPLRNRFLNAVWQYHHDRSSSEIEIETAKQVFDLIMQDRAEEARRVAERTPATKTIFEIATGGSPAAHGR